MPDQSYYMNDAKMPINSCCIPKLETKLTLEQNYLFGRNNNGILYYVK
jgi:hypothetical protein